MTSVDFFKGQYKFLSNFYPADFVVNGTRYQTVEHYFQACKTRDPEEKQRVIDAADPGTAKRLGQHVTLRPDWELNKNFYMFKGVNYKFRDNPGLMEQLVATGSDHLREGNEWNDRYWGQVLQGNSWAGENWLGLILMTVRTRQLCQFHG